MSVRSSLSWSQTTWKGPKEVARLVDFLTTATRILMTVMMMMSLWCRVYLTENCLAAPSRVPALVAALQSPRNLRPLCVDQFFFFWPLSVQHLNGPPFHWTIKLITFFVFLFGSSLTPTAAANNGRRCWRYRPSSLSVAKIWKSQPNNNMCRVKRSKSSDGRRFQMNENIFRKNSLKIAKN